MRLAFKNHFYGIRFVNFRLPRQSTHRISKIISEIVQTQNISILDKFPKILFLLSGIAKIVAFKFRHTILLQIIHRFHKKYHFSRCSVYPFHTVNCLYQKFLSCIKFICIFCKYNIYLFQNIFQILIIWLRVLPDTLNLNSY